jgi:3-carboxy-cis,cis-muconate cycloisomerase
MPAAPADSALYAGLLGDRETAALFSDTAEVRAMLIVEGTLARVQGDLGVIPADAAAFLHRASLDVQIDPAGLTVETARNGVPVPALITAFRKGTEAPDMTRWLHWGATSQDIMDTALALRLKRVLDLWETRLAQLTGALGLLALAHADTAMAARTYGQAAVPTSFGALVASWGRPLLRHRSRLQALAPNLLQVSLSGAAGTAAALGDKAAATRAGMATALGLTDPGASWHAERDGIAAFGAWMAGVTATLGKMGVDLGLLCQTGINEVAISGAGGSSTMPHKQNPVGPAVLVALGRQVAGLSSTLTGAAIHPLQRDGAAWFTEWLTLPQMCISTGCALSLALDIARRVVPDIAAMDRGLQAGHGTLFAEALTFALSDRMPRSDAAVIVANLAAQAQATGTALLSLAARDYPDTNWHQRLTGAALLGTAPDDARAFAQAALARQAASVG